MYTYRRVAVGEENQFVMVLDSPGWVLLVKNTNVKKIVCEDLIIRGVLYSKLYGILTTVKSGLQVPTNLNRYILIVLIP